MYVVHIVRFTNYILSHHGSLCGVTPASSGLVLSYFTVESVIANLVDMFGCLIQEFAIISTSLLYTLNAP